MFSSRFSGIEFARRFGGFVGGNFFWSRFDVVTDLVARLVIAAAGEGEFVGSPAIARRAGDLGTIFIERILERVGLHQHVDLPFAVPDFFLKFIPQISDRLWFSFHDELDHFLQEDALEFFESARFKGAALDDHLAIFGKECVILRLVAEHGIELFVEIDFNSLGQFLPQTFAQFGNLVL